MNPRIRNTESLAHAYFFAKSVVIEQGYFDEIEWQEDASFDEVTESTFLEESAWVILSSGMNENVIRRVFPSLTKAFLNFKSSRTILENKEDCLKMGLEAFNNPKKLESIVDIASLVNLHGFNAFIMKVQDRGIEFIKQLPHLGPVTSYHLAKNLGMDIAKPDRHLVRIATCMGFRCPVEMCQELSVYIQEKVSVIDIVFWRFANMNRNYLTQILHHDTTD